MILSRERILPWEMILVKKTRKPRDPSHCTRRMEVSIFVRKSGTSWGTTSGERNARDTSRLLARTAESLSGGDRHVRMAWAEGSRVCELRWTQTQDPAHQPQRAVET